MSDVEEPGFDGMRFRKEAIAARSIRAKLSGEVLSTKNAGEAFAMALEIAGAQSETASSFEQFLNAARVAWMASPGGPPNEILDRYIDP